MQKRGLARIVQAEEEEFGMFIEQPKISESVPDYVEPKSIIGFSLIKGGGNRLEIFGATWGKSRGTYTS